MPTKDLVVCWISSSADVTGSFKRKSPETSVHVEIGFGSFWVSPKGHVTLPKPYQFETSFLDSHNGENLPKIVSSGKSMALQVYPGTALRVYTPDGILEVDYFV